MASTTSNHSHRFLPPSPPNSLPTVHQRRQKSKESQEDPFWSLPTTPLPSPPSSESDPLHSQIPESEESLFTRSVINPVLFLSFLFSLCFVNWRDRVRRTRHNSKVLSYFWPTTWIAPEPYQDPSSSAWGRRDSVLSLNGSGGGHVEPEGVLKNAGRKEKGTGEEGKRWYLHRKIRKVSKLEIGDALEMRGRVIVGMVVGVVMMLVGVVVSLRWLVRLCWG
ncbi:hypothetical protein GQ43DRAFT_442149 [Delitschia confertaspora ATCC 74209]|uniref:Uncharacterized protein n=1 Tax=Delitschia confertaspora ATCC 74209 TaxID=1513339 RepID=A0A9P4MRD0_9PLEO|nr:hypothetical protein GQ43DRAFT_442149 [Delitschia confertaspora ATCC 74209]